MGGVPSPVAIGEVLAVVIVVGSQEEEADEALIGREGESWGKKSKLYV